LPRTPQRDPQNLCLQGKLMALTLRLAWCPLKDEYGTTSVRVTSISRECDFWTKHRMQIRFGQQTRGKEWWTINNPKQKLVRYMLKALQQKPESGAILAHLKLPGWQSAPRMFQRKSRERQDQQYDASDQETKHGSNKEVATSEPAKTQDESEATDARSCPAWWSSSTHERSQEDRYMTSGCGDVWSKQVTGWKSMKRQYILLGGDKAGANTVDPNSNASKLKPVLGTVGEFSTIDQ